MDKRRFVSGLLFLLSVILLSACYQHAPRQKHVVVADSLDRSGSAGENTDSLQFLMSHHYSINYNFVVKANGMTLTKQLPEESVVQMMVDTFHVRRNEHVAVAEVRILPYDVVDSVWVKLATDQYTFGWIHEDEMLRHVVPDDPISQFISFFSDRHLHIFLTGISLILLGYAIRIKMKRKAHFVLFNDIDTFYPSLLAFAVAVSSTIYSSIQNLCPDSWLHYYFHPSLNPLTQPLPIALFLLSVWLILMLALAAVDDVFRHLHFYDALFYLLGLVALCAFNYMLFSISTLYYIGYVLLLVYGVFTVWKYVNHTRSRYICGNCGLQMHQKGTCPHCGAVNV